MWGAIFASTLTTLAVFIPILFIEEEVGQLFQDIAVAISSAVFLSMVVSTLVIPVLSRRLLNFESRHPPKPGGLKAAVKNLFGIVYLAGQFNKAVVGTLKILFRSRIVHRSYPF